MEIIGTLQKSRSWWVKARESRTKCGFNERCAVETAREFWERADCWDLHAWITSLPRCQTSYRSFSHAKVEIEIKHGIAYTSGVFMQSCIHACTHESSCACLHACKDELEGPSLSLCLRLALSLSLCVSLSLSLSLSLSPSLSLSLSFSTAVHLAIYVSIHLWMHSCMHALQSAGPGKKNRPRMYAYLCLCHRACSEICWERTCGEYLHIISMHMCTSACARAARMRQFKLQVLSRIHASCRIQRHAGVLYVSLSQNGWFEPQRMLRCRNEVVVVDALV